MNSWLGDIRLFARAIRVSFATSAAYRGDFLLGAVVAMLLEVTTPLVTVLIYRAGSTFPGWSMAEALVLQATFLMARGVAFPCFFGMVWTVFEQVREGTFELTLLKPRSSLLLVLASGFDVQGLGRLLGGVALFVVALRALPTVSYADVVLYAALFAVSVLVLFAFALWLAGSLFVLIGNGRVFEVLEAVLVFGQYPGTIYSHTFQLLLAVGIPVSMIASVPAQALLGRPAPHTYLAMCTSVVFFAASLCFWRCMVRRYQSGGG